MKPSWDELYQHLDEDAARGLLELARRQVSLTLLANLKESRVRMAQNTHNRSRMPSSRMFWEYEPPSAQRTSADATPPPGFRITRSRRDGEAEKCQTGKQMAAP